MENGRGLDAVVEQQRKDNAHMEAEVAEMQARVAEQRSNNAIVGADIAALRANSVRLCTVAIAKIDLALANEKFGSLSEMLRKTRDDLVAIKQTYECGGNIGAEDLGASIIAANEIFRAMRGM